MSVRRVAKKGQVPTTWLLSTTLSDTDARPNFHENFSKDLSSASVPVSLFSPRASKVLKSPPSTFQLTTSTSTATGEYQREIGKRRRGLSTLKLSRSLISSSSALSSLLPSQSQFSLLKSSTKGTQPLHFPNGVSQSISNNKILRRERGGRRAVPTNTPLIYVQRTLSLLPS